MKRLLSFPRYIFNLFWIWFPNGISKAKANPFRENILILSLPRSGSSWVGETIGKAESVAYLREPVTQSLLKRRYNYTSPKQQINTVFEIEDRKEEKLFSYLVHGIPRFRPGIITEPCQWTIEARTKSSLVVKEVNPLAFKHELERLKPRIVFLVRHPAAVASSFLKLGWFDGKDWYGFGKRQANILKQTLQMLENYGDFLVVEYEDVTIDPITEFNKICHYCNISFDGYIQKHISSSTSVSTHDDPYNTSRDSKIMKDIWKKRLKEEDVEALMEGFRSENTRFYK